jgi:hypothetical protein
MRLAKSAVIAWALGVSVAAIGQGSPVWAEEKTRKPPTQQQGPAKPGQPKGFHLDLDGANAGSAKGDPRAPGAPGGKAAK